MSVSIEQRMAKLQLDVEALSDAIQADESQDQSGIREEMGKLYEQFKVLIVKAQPYVERARKISEKADAQQENAHNFLDSAEELLDSIKGASEAMDPEQWNWGDEEEET
jgi:TolA-binding protein